MVSTSGRRALPGKHSYALSRGAVADGYGFTHLEKLSVADLGRTALYILSDFVIIRR